MLSNFVATGDRIELQAVERNPEGQPEGLNGEQTQEAEGRKVYISRVHDILSEETMEIEMPMEKTKLILLPVDSEYDMVLYAKHGLYQCFVRIIDRYKSDNIYLLVVELSSNLRRYQRREYYRYSCALEMCSRTLQDEELEAIKSDKPYKFDEGLPLKESVIVDISGGGLRFLSSFRYEPDSLLYISYYLVQNEEKKKYEVLGKVVGVSQLENRKDTYEHRVQYYHLNANDREEIIKYIFAEERKNRKKGRLS